MSEIKTKTPAQTKDFVAAVAQKQHWQVNPEQNFVEKIYQGLTTNHNRYGYFLCPCRDGDGLREADRDIMCPCAYAKPDIAEFGHCFCGLFLSQDFADSESEPGSIPERRYQDPPEAKI